MSPTAPEPEQGASAALEPPALTAPEQRYRVRPGRDVLQSRIVSGNRIYLVRVFVDVDRRPADIVTVYRTSNVAKHWRAEP